MSDEQNPVGKPVPPISDRLMADIDAALMQKVFDVPKGKWEPDVHHHRQAEDLGAGLEVAKWGTSCHLKTLRNRPAPLKTVSPDKTLPRLASKGIVRGGTFGSGGAKIGDDGEP